MPKHRDIFSYLNQIAPYEDAESWDPTGPTIGWPDHKTKSAVISLDLTSEAYSLALQNNCNLIITHHPFIFSPISTIIADDFEQKLLLDLASNQITSFSCHTNLDAATEGVATTFLKTSLKSIGYSPEIEILVPSENKPDVGHGRVVNLNKEQMLSYLLKKIEDNLKTTIQVNTDQDVAINKIVFTPGAFEESWISDLVKRKIDLLITGEIKHHATVMLKERNIALFAAGHGASEQTIIPFLKKKLEKKFPEISFVKNLEITYNQLRSE